MVLESIDFVGFISWFDNIGGFDVILPFLLIFAIVFAILDKTNLFGQNKRNINTIISIILAFFLVAQRDVVFLLQEFLPRVSMLIITLIMILIVMGTFGFPIGENWKGLSAIIGIVGVLWAYGASRGWDVPALDYFTDQDVAILLIVGIFLLVIWFIVKEPENAGRERVAKQIWNFLKGFSG